LVGKSKVAISIFKSNIGRMIPRPDYLAAIEERVKHNPVVALLGPHQSGKTTLAKLYAEGKPCEFLDLETLGGLDRLQEPAAALEPLRGLVVIDEVHVRGVSGRAVAEAGRQGGVGFDPASAGTAEAIRRGWRQIMKVVNGGSAFRGWSTAGI
jgi:hypothetical protein